MSLFQSESTHGHRYSLLARRYVGNSFHLIFRAKFISDIVDERSDLFITDTKVEAAGAILKKGNRWHWKNGLSMGLDWARTNVPIFERKIEDGVLRNSENSGDWERVKKGTNLVSSIPSFTLFGIYLGYTF